MGFLCRTHRGINTLVNFGSFYWFGVICDVVFCWRDLAMWWVTHRLSVTNVDTRSDKMYSKSRGGRRLHNSGRRLFWPSDYFQRVMQRAPIAWPASIWWYFWCEPCENAVQTVWAQMGAGSAHALGTLLVTTVLNKYVTNLTNGRYLQINCSTSLKIVLPILYLICSKSANTKLIDLSR